MKKRWLSALLLICAAGSQAQGIEPAPTTVMILGVDHAVQLVASNDRPALLDAFLDRAAPDAICIERAPEAYARGDFYEFTYEVQDVVVPFARRHRIELCPIDWQPPAEDAELGFGIDFETPPELRPAKGVHQFLKFGQDSLARDFFHADGPNNLERVIRWTATPAARGKDDLPRRLYLYRTYLQARRVAAAARAHPGGTVVVVVGEFHKHDIKAVLKDEPGIRLVQPSSLGRPGEAEIEAHDRPEYRVAIASFNLLGTQSSSGAIDWGFVRGAVEALEATGTTPQTQLFRTRLDLLEGRIRRGEAIERYRVIAASAGDAKFSWNGVKDSARVDSYFDPFGNLDVRRRALLEAARELLAARDRPRAERLRDECLAGLSPRQRAQLLGYWQRDVVEAGTKTRP
ncbi:hypothetical protein [Lysobacter sp. CA199]|uniref:hypothetical protein n=1 Tax=Lysobacter sp. CA199 TaxID=3455608 RepID=UPI003F8D1AD9